MQKKTIIVLSVLGAVAACSNDPDELIAPTGPGTTVNIDQGDLPYDSLSSYGFFTGDLQDLQPVQGVLPYAPITPLFSDYAHKSRFVWMPAGSKAQYVSDDAPLDFPDGTVLIKNFWFERVQPTDMKRVLETRMLFKRNGEWEFANYKWNAAQNEAVLDLFGSFAPLQWLDDDDQSHDVVYRIPSDAECLVCHKQNDIPEPIGPKPRNLNGNFQYADGTMNQLQKWIQAGYLDNTLPGNVGAVTDWKDPNATLNDRVRAYVDMNCAHCHSDGKHCDYRPMRFAWQETDDPINLGECVIPDQEVLPDLTHIVARGDTAASMLYYRIGSTDETLRMPLLGRTVVHEEAKQLFADWITSLTPSCN